VGRLTDWTTIEGFERYVQALRDQAREDAPRPEGYVPCTTFWWIDETEYLGRIASGTGSTTS